MNRMISNTAQVIKALRYTLTEGKGKGLDVIDCTVGKTRALLNVTKCLDVMQAYHCGENLSFISKNGFSAGNAPFMNRFEGGMVYTCGLDSVGGREGFEVHGSVHNQTAFVTGIKKSEGTISVEAEIRDTELFGRNLLLLRKVEISEGEISIEDKIVNKGVKDADFCLLYHINLGYPLLCEGGEIVANVKEIKPRNAYAETKISECFKTTAATDEEECCYFLKLNEKKVSYRSENGKSFNLSFEGEGFDNFVLWKSMVAGDYALGLEPATTELDDNFKYQQIKSGETRKFNVKIEIQG